MKDQYATYTSIQLAGEESFIRWILHGENEVQWNHLLEHHPALQNKTEEARRIVLALSDSSMLTLPASETNALWNRIETSIKTSREAPATNHLTLLLKWGLAAAASLALMVWFNAATHKDQFFAQTGEQKEIKLTDESTVTLNAGSGISYKRKSFTKERILHLDGEAFFKVKPGSTFTVNTDFGDVTVVGTSFNVVAREGYFEVNCYTGKVKVENKKQDQQLITAGERVTTDQKDQALVRSVFVPSETGPEWMRGKFIFADQPLSRVVAELERQYGVKVNLEKGLENQPYTGLFESGDLGSAVHLITWPLHIKATISGKTVTITR